MEWLWTLLGGRLPELPEDERDRRDFAQREANLQSRLERLSREVEVVQRDMRQQEPR